MTGELWRCFVAVPIDERLRTELRSAAEDWPRLDGLRWTDPVGWHITLAFLGRMEATAVPSVAERLASVVDRHGRIPTRMGGLGAFPAPARARVAWYGVEDGLGQIERLAQEVAAALDLDVPRTLRPHVTLALAQRRPVDLRAWLAAARAPAGAMVVDRVSLLRSHLEADPVRYEALSTISLGVRPRV